MVTDTSNLEVTSAEHTTAPGMDVVELLAEMTAAAGAGEGTVDVPGFTIRQARTHSMVHMNGQELPARFAAFRRDGHAVTLPTAQAAHQLAKRDADGQPVFHIHRGGVACRICPPPAEPIAETCVVCQKVTGRAKRFFDDIELEAHYETYHPREWRSIQRRQEREAANRGLTPEQLVKLLAQLSPEERAALLGDSPAKKGRA